MLAVLRSQYKSGQAIGAMITASHNPGPDNGVKLVDPAGEMLEAEWEAVATSLANCEDKEVPGELERIVVKYGIDRSAPSLVIVGRDTRVSSPSLASACLAGVSSLGGRSEDLGLVTTPQLHYMVVATNTKGGYGQPSLPGYYDKLAGAFKKFMALIPDKGSYRPKLVFDGANGVGAVSMKEFATRLSGILETEIANTGETGELNSGCGADYVKTKQSAPLGMSPGPGVRHVSVDGDADRVVYYFVSADGKFRLLDGDRIATLVAGHVKHLLAEVECLVTVSMNSA